MRFVSFRLIALILLGLCGIHSAADAASPECDISSSTPVSTLSPCPGSAVYPSYVAARSDQGAALYPIDAWNICRYVDNGSSATSIFVPFNTAAEWTAFRNYKPAYISLATCSRPDNILIPSNNPNYPSGSPNPFYFAGPPDVTCAQAQTQNTSLSYARTGMSYLVSANFTCVQPGYTCFPSGSPCGNNQTWVETATATFTAGISSDITSIPSGWTLSSITYGGGPKPILQSADCLAATQTWTVGSNTCSGTIAATTNGSSNPVTVITGGSGSSASYTCTNGSYSLNSGATCTSDCSSGPISWTVGSYTCNGAVTATPNGGDSSSVTATSGGTGTATFTCNNGSYTPDASANCSVATGCNLPTPSSPNSFGNPPCLNGVGPINPYSGTGGIGFSGGWSVWTCGTASCSLRCVAGCSFNNNGICSFQISPLPTTFGACP